MDIRDNYDCQLLFSPLQIHGFPFSWLILAGAALSVFAIIRQKTCLTRQIVKKKAKVGRIFCKISEIT
jgi:hypothetical protein